MSDFYEDLEIGTRIELGSYRFTREAIVSFAGRFDPQPFHVDEAAARSGPFGRLAASGWHTASVWMKLYAEYRNAAREGFAERGEAVAVPGPSPGFKNLRWLKPVLVDETIAFAFTITRKRPTQNPGWGLAFRTGTGHNQNGELVYSFEGSVMVQRRPKAEAVNDPRTAPGCEPAPRDP